ncbi:MAG: hypothetical protein J0L51_14965 [Rhizobiales bacterium]|nr:hypothetical protein [Hyphomicrobiales bacterium]
MKVFESPGSPGLFVEARLELAASAAQLGGMSIALPRATGFLSSIVAMLSLATGLASAQHHPIPGRMPSDMPYAHEYGAGAPTQPAMPLPPPPHPIARPLRLPEQAEGYQPVRPAPPIGARIPERHAVPPERIPRLEIPARGKLIDVPGPTILER